MQLRNDQNEDQMAAQRRRLLDRERELEADLTRKMREEELNR